MKFHAPYPFQHLPFIIRCVNSSLFRCKIMSPFRCNVHFPRKIVEDCFMCLLTIQGSFPANVSFAHFFCWVEFFPIGLKFFIYFGSKFIISYKYCLYFLPVCGLTFYFLLSLLTEVFIVMKLTSSIFSAVIRIFISLKKLPALH